MEIVPVTRKEKFIKAAIDAVPLSIDAIPRIEMYLAKISGDNVDLPDPITRIEKYLAVIAGMDVVLPSPVTRVEKYLAKIAGMDVETPDPVTRIEMLLDEWAESSGGVLKTVSGAVVSVSDALKKAIISLVVSLEPIQDLHGYANPWPAGGGVNIFDEEMELGILNNDGTVSDSTSRLVNKNFMSITAETEYCYSWDVPSYSSTARPRAAFYDSNYQFVLYVPDLGETPTTVNGRLVSTFTTPASSAYIKFCMYTSYGTTYKNDITFNISNASYNGKYYSYSNLCPITGFTGVNVQRTGKNLFDNTILGSSGWNRYFKNPLKSAGTITFSCGEINLGNDKKGGALYFADESMQRIGNYISGYDFGRTVFSATINATQEQADAPYILFLSNGGGCTQEIIDNAHIQLELGSTATAYEPYQGTSVEVALGQTVYGGSLDVTTGVLTVDRAMFEANTATMNNSEAYPGWRPAGVRENGAKGGTFNNGLTNVGRGYSVNVNNDNDIIYLPTQLYNGRTQSDWIALAVDVQIVYELATPIVIHLTPTEIEMLEGNNTLWADTGDITVTYMADGPADDVEALNILLGNRYVNLGEPDEATDREALDILLGGR